MGAGSGDTMIIDQSRSINGGRGAGGVLGPQAAPCAQGKKENKPVVISRSQGKKETKPVVISKPHNVAALHKK